MSWHVLTSLLGCVAQWCLLGFVAFQTRRTRFARVLSALCVTFLAWTYAAAAFQATGGVVWHWLDLGVSPFVPPLGLGLVIAFTGGGRGQWLAWLMVSVAFAALAATGWAALWWVPARRWVASDGWPLVYLAFFLPTIAFSLALLARYRRLHVSARLEVSRGRWLFWGIAIGAALALTELFADLGFEVPRLGHVASLTTSLIVTWLGLGRGLLDRPSGAVGWVVSLGGAVLTGTGATMLVLLDRDEALAWGAVVLGLSTCAAIVAGMWRTSAHQHARERRMALMGRMSAQLAHDLRNPLAAIVGAVDVLEVEEGSAESDNETRERMLALIRQQADRMGALTNRYVSMTKVQGVEPQAVALPALIHGAWGAAGLGRPVPEVPDWKAWVDGALLGAALQNLLANAADAAETEVTLMVSRVGSDLIVQIADDGPGVNPRDIELIREGFHTTKATGSAGCQLRHTGRSGAWGHAGPDQPARRRHRGSAGPAQSSRRDFMTASILVVEDDEPVRMVMETLLVQAGHRVHAVADGEAAVAALGKTSFDLVVTDVRMPGVDGMTLLGRVRVEQPGTPVVVVTGHGDVAMAVEAMKRGAAEFFLKPVARTDLLGAVERALGPPVPSGVRVPATLRPRLRQLAETDAPLLVLGPSGAGKVTLARAVHEQARAEDPFVIVDVPAITPSLFEATLFGHEPGAFSGATGDSAGVLRSAGDGTVVLARIDGLALDLQAKLLRTLQEREVRPVGSTAAEPLRARIVATAAADLQARVADGRFREDLYYRLAVLVVEVPPLRERGSELPDLLVSLWPSETPRPTVAPEALEVWKSHPWPGNVSELSGLVHRIAALGLRTIDAPTARRLLSDTRTTAALDLDRERARTEADVVRQALAACGGNKSEAARLLGVSRGTLYNKLRADEDRD